MKDLIFQALASMGNASAQMSWANTCLEDVDIPEEVKAEMKQINTEIHRLQERLREIRGTHSNSKEFVTKG